MQLRIDIFLIKVLSDELPESRVLVFLYIHITFDSFYFPGQVNVKPSFCIVNGHLARTDRIHT